MSIEGGQRPAPLEESTGAGTKEILFPLKRNHDAPLSANAWQALETSQRLTGL